MIKIILLISSLFILNSYQASQQIGAFFTETTFSSSQGWGIIGSSAIYDTQMGKSVFGGKNGFAVGTTIYKLLEIPQPHHTIRMKLRIWAINKWESEYIIVKADGVVVNKQLVHSGLTNNFAQFLFQEIFFFHSAPSVIIEITSTLDEANNNESWGVRDIDIQAITCPVGCDLCSYSDTLDTCPKYLLQTSNFATSTFTTNQGWVVQDSVVQQLFCDKILMFGYFPTGVSIFKKFYLPTTFYKVKVKFQFWKIDAISTSISHALYANGDNIWNFDQTKTKTLNICSLGSNEEYVNVDVEFESNSQLITFQFYSDSVAGEYYGIRDFYIYALLCEDQTMLCINSPTEIVTNPDILDFQQSVSHLVTSFSSSLPSEWSSYQSFSATPRISVPKCTEASVPIQYMALYDTLYKDFTLNIHKTLKMIFYMYSQSKQNDVLLYVDDNLADTIQIGYSSNDVNCAGSASGDKYEEYTLYAVEVDHTSLLTRITFKGRTYTGGNFLQGFNKFEIYTGNCDCEICTDSGTCATVYSLVDIDFAQDTLTDNEKWQLITYSIQATTCNTKEILGGYNVISKVQQVRALYKSLPTHLSLRIQMNIYFLSNWANTEYLVITLDNVEVWRQKVLQTNYASQLCSAGGATYQVVEIDLYVSHAQSEFTLIFNIESGSGDEYWGVRDFIVSTSNQIIS
ncbi:unnamed protein product [Paramecium primaurelia]|uniref:Uncharacterized protein n=1 Tax=Paramecium primaurelia TaxID=5886 RepID=A0A8S1PZR7_PARPR|nr:unnamed protein product [Paramecium primaurelia]